MKNIPNIRFKGFSNDWEQRKLGELYEVNNERNKNLIGYDKTFSIATMTYKDEGNGASDSSLANYKVLRIGDIAFEGHTNKEFRYGRFVANDVGDGIMSPRFSTLRPISKMPVSFWKYYIHYEPIMRKILVCSTKAGTMMNELVPSDFFAQDILVPSIEEQEKIGSYFNQLDNLITLHQRKCDETKTLKKYMLQKMFPKNGEDRPEIRFEGFTDAWEQRKFGDEFKLSQGLQVPVEEQFAEQLENTEQFIRIIDVTQEGEPPRYVYNPTGKGRVKTDDIFFVRYGAVGTIGYGYNGVIANNLFKAEPLFKACNMFLFQQFSGTDFNKMLKEMSASTSMPAVNFGALNNLTFSIPSYEEQNKIGEYLGQLDNLITLHQHKCDEIKELKKYMLQNMFPQ